HPTRQPGHRPAHHQLQKAKGPTDSVGGPSRKIEANSGLDGDERDAWNKGCITGMALGVPDVATYGADPQK
ncbi:hypothetical protein, partial [Streptomyces chromofuscus]|uniref:hypothetical protein n=1 Tax=Streptomyces chromofuscus TaxID=42881 RepID=UPI001E4A1D41